MILGIGAPSLLAASDDAVIADIERKHAGRLGVFAIDTGSGRTLAYRADERFLMCSTFKGLLAGLVLARVDAGKEALTRLLPYSEKDLIFTSPVTKANVSQGALSIKALCQAMLEVSDNTASILLMRSVGGPAALTQFLRGLGDIVTQSDRYEPASNLSNAALDTTTPRAIIGAINKLLLGDILRSQSRDQLETWMIACKPGMSRIRAVLPTGWIAGDRPGTSVEAQTNDYAIIRPPGRAPLLLAIYYDAPALTTEAREAVLRETSAVFVKWAGG